VQQYVVPALTPFPGERSVVVVDGAQIHNQGALNEAVEAVGARLLVLPPYSPEYDPVEHVFSKVKHLVRRMGHWLVDNGVSAYDMLDACFAQVRPEDCMGWVRRCGY